MDQKFNFGKMMKEAKTSGIGKVTGTAPKVAVIAGLTVASESYRSGVRQIDIFEASDRVGGRDYSLPVGNRSMVSTTV